MINTQLWKGVVKVLKAVPASYTGPNWRVSGDSYRRKTPASGPPPTASPGPVASAPIAAAPSCQ